MAMIFDGDSKFLFHDECVAPTILLTDDEKAQCVDYDAEKAAEKRAEEYEAPEICDECGAFLVEDERAPESPLARDLRNMAVQYHDSYTTDLLWRLAAMAERHDANTYNLYYYSARMLHEWEYPIPATLFREALPACVHATQRAITMIQAWAQKWDGRAILTLHEVTDEDIAKHDHLDCYSYADASGDGWEIDNTSGSTDMFCDGTMECSGCGTRLTSIVAYDPSNPNMAYGPCCFIVE